MFVCLMRVLFLMGASSLSPVTSVSVIAAGTDIDSEEVWLNHLQNKVDEFNKKFRVNVMLGRSIDLSEVSYPEGQRLHLKASEVLREWSSIRTRVKLQRALWEENQKELGSLQAQMHLLNGNPDQKLLQKKVFLFKAADEVLKADLESFCRTELLLRSAIEKYETDVEDPKVLERANLLFLGQINPTKLQKRIKDILEKKTVCSLAINDLNVERNDGRSLFMLAAERGEEAIVDLLINAGVDLGKLDHQGNSAISLAGKNLHYDLQKKILERDRARTLGQRLRSFLRSIFSPAKRVTLDTPDLAEKLRLKSSRYQRENNCYAYAIGNFVDGYRQKFSVHPVKKVSPLLFAFQYESEARRNAERFLPQVRKLLERKNLSDETRADLLIILRHHQDILDADFGMEGGNPEIFLRNMIHHRVSFENGTTPDRAELGRPQLGSVIVYLTDVFRRAKEKVPDQFDLHEIGSKLKSILKNKYRIKLNINVLEECIQSALKKTHSLEEFLDQILNAIEMELNRLNGSSFSFGSVPPVVVHQIEGNGSLRDLFHKEWDTVERQNPILLDIDRGIFAHGPAFLSKNAKERHTVVALGSKLSNGRWMIQVKDSNPCETFHKNYSCHGGLTWIDFEALAPNTFVAYVFDPTAERIKPKWHSFIDLLTPDELAEINSQ